MARDTSRLAELTEAATDYALQHGLIGLSLRPLAAALGTSDRMLLYHFGTKDDLVAAVMKTANDRSVREVRGLPPSADVRQAVLELWATVNTPEQQRCQRLYVEASALGLLGQEPYATSIAAANESWEAALTDHLAASGAPPELARRAMALVDAAFMGFQLDLPVGYDLTAFDGAVADLAAGVAAVVDAWR